MKKLILFSLLALFSLAFFAYRFTATVDKDAAKKGAEYLNKVRQAPASFSKEIGTDLSYISKKPALKWNDTLAKVAEAKALDMAKRKYFAHVDPDGNGINVKINKAGYKLPASWIKDPKENYFESISAGNEDCLEAMRSLILDEGLTPPDHRNHLMGLNDFWDSCTDIGIGFATDPDSEYRTYTCVIIAKHNY
jgi:uncharacterized protein YkwD